MTLAFDLEERLAGSYWLLDEPFVDRPIALELRARVVRLERYGFDRTAALEGRVVAEGLARDAALEGTSRFGSGGAQRQTFELWFRGDDGAWRRLRGHRDFQLHALPDALTHVPFSLYDARGVELGRGLLRFDPKRDLGRLVGSARLRLTAKWLGGRGLSVGLGGRLLRLEGPETRDASERPRG